MKVLYLTEWYPHRYDAMSGLFVRKHAEAVVRQGCDVCVLFLYEDNSISRTEIVSTTTNGVKEIYVYYQHSYLKALVRGWKETKKRWGIPDLCQLNVITKNAILPLWLRLTRNIPYIIVEHWTGYLPISFAYKGFLHKRLAETAANNASAIMPVSRDLAKAMQQCGLRNRHWQVINNVADDFFYTTEKQPHHLKTILHISCFDEPHKNVCGILRAVKQTSLLRQDFRLVIVGTGPDFGQVYQYAQTLHFPDRMLIWTGEQTPRQVAEWFGKSDFFLLFSNTENAPVVISEALATGTPVLSSAVGGITEMIDSNTGVLVEAGDENALALNINRLLDTYLNYDSRLIRQYGGAYSYNKVGQQFLTIYNETLEHK
ncbi:MAG: glycosyltransferase [Paludibacteraceae bacterium]|nr:glycosyltransferase [Paludibacteraceae bacterium]